jgi:hypothetical protein
MVSTIPWYWPLSIVFRLLAGYSVMRPARDGLILIEGGTAIGLRLSGWLPVIHPKADATFVRTDERR